MSYILGFWAVVLLILVAFHLIFNEYSIIPLGSKYIIVRYGDHEKYYWGHSFLDTEEKWVLYMSEAKKYTTIKEAKETLKKIRFHNSVE